MKPFLPTLAAFYDKNGQRMMSASAQISCHCVEIKGGSLPRETVSAGNSP